MNPDIKPKAMDDSLYSIHSEVFREAGALHLLMKKQRNEAL